MIEDVELAPAKVNLALHVTGRRQDGYHLLDTLVIHGGAADRVFVSTAADRSEHSVGSAEPSQKISLTIEGPFAEGLRADGANLVIEAALLLASEARRIGRSVSDVALRLDKRLPIASGIGGGSSDAAATLRLLDRIWGLNLGRRRLAELSLPLGADVPMCVWGAPLRARGIGEAIDPLPSLPSFGLVLVNPGAAVSTPAVFRALQHRDNPPMPEKIDRFASIGAFVEWLRTTRNDLQSPAMTVAPVIGDVIAWLEAQPGCLMARMSGSGATCFGLFEAVSPTLGAAPGTWWVGSTRP